MLWFEYDGPNNEGVTDRGTEMAFIRENMPPATSCHCDDVGFTVMIWDTKAGVIERTCLIMVGRQCGISVRRRRRRMLGGGKLSLSARLLRLGPGGFTSVSSGMR